MALGLPDPDPVRLLLPVALRDCVRVRLPDPLRDPLRVRVRETVRERVRDTEFVRVGETVGERVRVPVAQPEALRLGERVELGVTEGEREVEGEAEMEGEALGEALGLLVTLALALPRGQPPPVGGRYVAEARADCVASGLEDRAPERVAEGEEVGEGLRAALAVPRCEREDEVVLDDVAVPRTVTTVGDAGTEGEREAEAERDGERVEVAVRVPRTVITVGDAETESERVMLGEALCVVLLERVAETEAVLLSAPTPGRAESSSSAAQSRGAPRPPWAWLSVPPSTAKAAPGRRRAMGGAAEAMGGCTGSSGAGVNARAQSSAARIRRLRIFPPRFQSWEGSKLNILASRKN